MLASINAFFEKYLASSDNRPAGDPQHRARLAAAALLVEVAQSDEHISAEEREALFRSVARKFNLHKDEADELLAVAKTEATGAVDLHQFTSQINRHFSMEQKIRLIEELWCIAYADQTLQRHEEHLVRKIADLIHVSHSALIAAKHRAG